MNTLNGRFGSILAYFSLLDILKSFQEQESCP